MKLFTCPNAPSNLRLTKKACANYYKTANQPTRVRKNAAHSSIYLYCVNCKIGKKNSEYYNGKIKSKRPKKVCKLYEIDPESCFNKKSGGIFYMENRHSEYDWNSKIFCCSACGLYYNYLKKQGRLK